MLPVRTRLTLAYTLALLDRAESLLRRTCCGSSGGSACGASIRELDALTATLANVIRGELAEHLDPLARAAEEARKVVTAPGRAVAIVDAHGTALAARWNGLDLPAEARTTDARRVTTVETPGGAWRVHATPRNVCRRSR